MKRPPGAPRAMYGGGRKIPHAAVTPQRSGRWWGKRNLYVCDTCHGVIITEDVDEGVTPAFLACRADLSENFKDPKRCKGTMQSQWYPPEPWDPTFKAMLAVGVARGGRVDRKIVTVEVPDQVSFEWYYPNRAELRSLDREVFDHVRRGGLLLRQREDVS